MRALVLCSLLVPVVLLGEPERQMLGQNLFAAAAVGILAMAVHRTRRRALATRA